jgi:hypothetical protein
MILALLPVLAAGGAWAGLRIAHWTRTDDARDWGRALTDRAHEHERANGYPINGAELARRLLAAETEVEIHTREDFKLAEYRVRRTLRQLGCPKQTASPRSDWVVDEQMASQVAKSLGLPL